MTEQTEASHEEGAAIASSAFWEAKQALAKRMAQAPLPAYYRKDEVCRIVEGLFLSSRFAEMDKQLLEGVGITHILQVGTELQPTHKQSSLTYMKVDLVDIEGEDIVMHLPACIDFIDKGRVTGAVLVHCAAGISRSASVCIAYLMARQQLPYAAAKAAVKAARPLIAPNEGFGYQLEAFGEAGCSAEGWQPWTLDRFMEERARRGRAFAAQRPVDDGSSMSDGDWGQAYQSYGAMVSSYGKRT